MEPKKPIIQVLRGRSGLTVEVSGNLEEVLGALHSICHRVFDSIDRQGDAEAATILFAHLAGSASNRVEEILER